MILTEPSLTELIEELSPDARKSVRDFVEFLVAKQRSELAKQAEANGWPAGYFEQTAGSIPDFPEIDTQGIDTSHDETAEELRIDLPEETL